MEGAGGLEGGMKKSWLILAGGDFLIASVVLVLVGLLAGRPTGVYLFDDPQLPIQMLVFGLAVILSAYFTELYSEACLFDHREQVYRVVVSAILALLLLSLLYYAAPWADLVPPRLVPTLCGFAFAQFLWHYRYPILLRFPGIAQGTVVFGCGPMAREVVDLLEDDQNTWQFKGCVQPIGEHSTVPRRWILGEQDELREMVQKEGARKIVIALSERRGILPVRDLLWCKLNGVEVIDAQTFYERVTGRLKIEDINPSWFIFSDGFRVTHLMLLQKRILDIFFSLTGLLVVAPFLPLIALAIRLDSKGPVIFAQERVGMGGKVFRTYKFRSMTVDAEKETGAVWAQANDPRVTRLGGFLRKTRIDEIPQLFNVLKGDMSFIGPRPERPEFVEVLTEKIPYYATRHAVKPGLTGWAQVCYPYGASEEDALEKLRYDLYYIKNYSPVLDLLIVLETIKVVLFARGGR